jgi:hypothetical protein
MEIYADARDAHPEKRSGTDEDFPANGERPLQLLRESAPPGRDAGSRTNLGPHEFSTRGRRKDNLHRYGRRRANSARNCSQVTDWARS